MVLRLKPQIKKSLGLFITGLKNKIMKTGTILQSRYRFNKPAQESSHTATLAEFHDYYNYTLETGKSYEGEKGNKKINLNPKSFSSLVDMLNKAVNNAAANGYSDTSYELVK